MTVITGPSRALRKGDRRARQLITRQVHICRETAGKTQVERGAATRSRPHVPGAAHAVPIAPRADVNRRFDHDTELTSVLRSSRRRCSKPAATNVESDQRGERFRRPFHESAWTLSVAAKSSGERQDCGPRQRWCRNPTLWGHKTQSAVIRIGASFVARNSGSPMAPGNPSRVNSTPG